MKEHLDSTAVWAPGSQLVAFGLALSLTVAGTAAPCPGRGCDGVGESDLWHVEYIGETADHRTRFRVTNKADGASRVLIGGKTQVRLRAILVYGSHAVSISYATRGFYYLALLDLAGNRRVAEFYGAFVSRSPDDRYVKYSPAAVAGAVIHDVHLVDLQSIDSDALIAARGDCNFMCPVRVGIPLGDVALIWDLDNSRMLALRAVPSRDQGLYHLVWFSLADSPPTIVCETPLAIPTGEMEAEFSGPVRARLRRLDFDRAAGAVVIEMEGRHGGGAVFGVPLAAVCGT